MENKLKELIGQKIIKSSAGGGAGSILKVEFENNSYLFIYCVWRIEHTNKVVVASSDTFSPSKFSDSLNGVIGKEAPILTNNRVLNIKLSPQYDLVLEIENDYVLRLFCDLSYSQEDLDINWELNYPEENISFTINNHFQLIRSKYDEEEDIEVFKPNFNLLDDLN